ARDEVAFDEDLAGVIDVGCDDDALEQDLVDDPHLRDRRGPGAAPVGRALRARDARRHPRAAVRLATEALTAGLRIRGATGVFDRVRRAAGASRLRARD